MPSIEEEVGQLLTDRGLTIAVAEACTAGTHRVNAVQRSW